MQTVLEIDHVSKSFDGVEAVADVSIEARPGEFLAIMGSSGCGKSTLLRMIAGLETPSEGDIRLNGHSTRSLPPHERDTPMVWQSLALFPFLNVMENVEFGLKMRAVGVRERRDVDGLTHEGDVLRLFATGVGAAADWGDERDLRLCGNLSFVRPELVTGLGDTSPEDHGRLRDGPVLRI